MACSCHTKAGVGVKRVSPFDQCTMCAKKHIVKAWNEYNEFTYLEDNRDVISGQLRMAVDHLMFDHPKTALMARNLAMIIEENRDKELVNEWQELLEQIRLDLNADHPDIAERLKNLQENSKTE